MRRFRRLAARVLVRPLFVLQSFVLVVSPGCVHPGALTPEPGVLEYRALLRVPVSGGEVDVGGGNLVVRRPVLSLDTLVGTVEVGAVYNSASRGWIWSFGMRYDGTTFVDATGAVHDLSDVLPGRVVPGTHWVKIDDTHVKTKGGLVHAFDPDSHVLRRVAWAVGIRPELVYEAATVAGAVRPIRLSQCDNVGQCHFVYDVAYDANGCVSGIADRAGREVVVVNDGACRPGVVRDPLDVAEGRPGWRYVHAGGLLTSATSSDGEQTRYDHLDGRVVAVRQIADPMRVTRFDYGATTAPGLYYTRVRDVRGGQSVYRYDAEGRLYSSRDAVGDERAYGWSGRRPAIAIDPAGALTRFTYEDDDPVRVVLPTGNALRFEYAPHAHDRSRPFERPLRVASDSLGVVEQRVYDAWGQLESVENGAGDRTAYSYDANGLVMLVSAPDGTLTWLEDYGEHGHPTRVIRSTFTDHRQYDAVGNLVEGSDVRDPLSPGRPGVGRLFYDANRNVSSVELLGSDTLEGPADVLHRLEIERRSDGRVRRIVRPYGGDAELVYDAFGDLVERRERVDGAWRSTRFERDPAGALVAIDLPNGMRRETKRDAIGRVVETKLVRDGVVAQTATSTWERGRLVARHDSIHGAPEQLVYDAAGRVERIHHPGGEITELEHDLRSRETRRTYRLAPSAPPLRTLERVFDGADREIELRDAGETLLAHEYAGGRPSRIRYGNGLVRDFEYDAELGVLIGTRTVSADTGLYVEGTRLGWSRCHLDALCVIAHTDIAGSPDGVAGMFTDESYRLGPLAAESSTTGVAGLRLQAFVPGDLPSELGYEAPRYAFDALGNWLGVAELEMPRTRFVFNDERNRLLAVEGAAPHAYTWDAAGFATARDGEPLSWSPNGRPTGIGTRIAMEWDVLGRPVSTTVDGVTTRMRFGGEVVADASGTPLRLDLGEVAIDLAGSGHVYRHHDFRGNVQMVTDRAGVVVRHHTYAPFGPAESFGPHPDDRSFAGGTEIGGLVMLGARLYDPDAGRFLSPDPIFHAVNQFAYTLGNPVFLWDPSGRHAESSANSDGEFLNHVADLMDSVGLILIAAGLASANFQFVGLGLLVLAASLKVRVRALSAGASCPACKVTVEEVHGDFGSGRPAYVEAADVNDLGCAPTAISATRTVPWATLVLVGLQIGLALLLTRRHRGERGR